MAQTVELNTVQAVKAIRNLRDQIKGMAKELGAGGDQLNFISKAMTGAANKVALLGTRVNKLNLENKELKNALNSANRELNTLKDKLSQAVNANEKMIKKQKESSEAAKDQKARFSELGRQMQVVRKSSEPLAKDFSDIGKQMQVVVRSSKATAASTTSLSVAMAKQEQLIVRAELKTKGLIQSIQQLNLTTEQETAITNQISTAFDKYQQELSETALGTVELTKANTRWIKASGDVGRAIRSTKLNRFAEVMGDLGSSAVLALGPLSGIGARIITIGAIAKRSNLGIAALATSLTAITVSFVTLTAKSIKAGLQLEKIMGTLRAGTGSMAAAAKEFSFVSEVASELGLNLPEAARQFSKLAAAARGTSLAGEGVRDIFEGVSVAATAMRLTTEQTTGALRAIEQMISKGNVQAEELRGQLGERLPGAFQLAAQAMGVTTIQLNKMLKDGEVLAEDLLPKLATVLKESFGPEAIVASEQLAAQIERLRTEVFETLVEFERWLDSMGLSVDLVRNFSHNLDQINTVSPVEKFERMTEAMQDSQEELKRLMDEGDQIQNLLKGAELGGRLQDLPVIGGLLGELKGLFTSVEEEELAAAKALEEYQFQLTNAFREAMDATSAWASLTKEEIAEIEKRGLTIPIQFLDFPNERLLEAAKASAQGPGNAPFGPVAELNVPGLGVSDEFREFREEMEMLGKPELEQNLRALRLRFIEIRDSINGLEFPKEFIGHAREDFLRKSFDATKRQLIDDTTASFEELEEQAIMTAFALQAANIGTTIPPDARDKMQGTRDDLEEVNDKLDESVPRINKLREEIDAMGISMAGVLAAGINKTTERMDKFGDTIDDLSLAEANKGLDDMRKAFEKAAKAAQSVEDKIQKAIDSQILVNANLRKQIGAEDEVVEQLKTELKVRQQNIGASETQIQKLIALRNEERKITEEIERQISRREAAARVFENLGKSTGPDPRDKLPPSQGRENVEAANVLQGRRGSVADELRDLERANAVLQQRIAGNDKLADQMEARFELMKKFPNLSTKELQNLQKELELNKQLTEVLKEQEELEKVRKELAEDFASAIGTAFEDAVIEGEKLSNVLQALLDDINRIILRVTVTKPLENLLTGIATGEDLTGSKAGPGGTPFFGGILGGLFKSGSTGGGASSPTGAPGPHGEVSEATKAATAKLNELAESSSIVAREHESLSSRILEAITGRTAERVTTTSLTNSLIEFQVAVRLATQALQAMATGVGAGAASGASSGGIAGLSSILNFSGSFGGNAGMPFGGGTPSFVPGFGFTGPRQHGGPSGPNSPVLVGERGPEIFLPNRSGRIEPLREDVAAPTVNLTQNIQTDRPAEFRHSARANLRVGARAAKSAFRRI